MSEQGRVSVAQQADVLRRVSFLAELDRPTLARLAGLLDAVDVDADDVICSEGDAADALFLVADGSFAVLTGDTRVNTLRPGDHFGELALLTDDVRSATVRAETPGQLLRLDRAHFVRLMDERPAVGREIAAALARRLRERDGGVRIMPTVPASAPAPRRRGRETAGAALAVGAVLLGAAFVTEVPARALLPIAAAIVLWVSGALPAFVVALALIGAWMLLGVASPAQALAGFSSSAWLFALAALTLASAVARSGALVRMGVWLLQRTPKNLLAQSGALTLTGVMLTPVLPLAMGRATLLSPSALEVARALRTGERTAASAVLGLASWLGAGPLMFLFLNGSPGCLLAWSLLPDAARAQFDWPRWTLAVAPLWIAIALGSFAALFVLFRPRLDVAPPRSLALELAVLGPPGRSEIAVLAIAALTVIGWAAAPVLRVDPAAVGIAGAAAALVAVRADQRAARELDWGYLIFLAAALAVAQLVVDLGIAGAAAGWLAERIAALGAIGPFAAPLFAALTFVARLFLLPEQTLLLLGIPAVALAPALGVEPWLLVIAILTMILSWTLPSQSPEYLSAHTASEASLYDHAQARRYALAHAAIVVVALTALAPYWQWIGVVRT